MNIAKMVMVGGLTLAVGPMGALADEAAKPTSPATPVVEKSTSATAVHPKMTPEQRAEMRARREKMIAERRAAMEAKMLTIVKKYVADENQAKALVKELQETMFHARRPPMKRPMPPAAQK